MFKYIILLLSIIFSTSAIAQDWEPEKYDFRVTVKDAINESKKIIATIKN